MKLKCPQNDKHDGFVQTITEVKTKFIDSTGKQYSFGNQTVRTGKIFCVICSAEVEDVKTNTSNSSKC